MGRKGKWEYFRVIYGRYGKADRKAKREMLNEFCLTTGYHRKYAIRILNGPAPGKRRDRPVRKRGQSYGHELLSVLTSVWEAAGYPWSVRLKALLPTWMPWIRKQKRQQGGWRSPVRAQYYPRNTVRWDSLFVNRKLEKGG